jgi:hypothetical protein
VHGFEVQVHGSGPVVEGELLAVDETSVWVEELGIERSIPRREIARVVIREHGTAAGGYGVWTGLGAASTLTHGFYFVLTGPLWLAVGIPVTALEAADGQQRLAPDGLDALFQYARWPQGMPPR